MASELDPAIAAHYRHDPERDRLETRVRLEAIRTRELLSRFLRPPRAVVLDVGGARGAYALGLAREGYGVHRPEELRQELSMAGLTDIQVLAVEGPGSFRDLGASLEDPTCRDALLRAIRRVEDEPTSMGASAHPMGIGRIPSSWR